MRLLGCSPCVLVLMAGCLLALPACGGGGSGATAMPSALHAPAPVTTPTAGPAGFAPVSFSIALPKSGAANVRKPLYVPASTTAITIAVNGTTPQTFPCTSGACSGSFLAPAGGSVNFVFAAVDGAGAVLANTPSFSQTIAPNGSNVLSVTLNGVIDHATLSDSPPGLSSAASGTATVTAQAFDADNDAITGTYSAPLTLAVNDTTGTVAITAGTLANDTAAGALAYTFSAATANIENHVFVAQSSTTETRAQHAANFEVGRTFYTFTPTAIVGFAPGATTPTRTVAQTFADVRAITCDGSNVEIVDYNDGGGHVYALAPGATTVTPYTTDIDSPIWVAGYGGVVATNHAQFYVANTFGESPEEVGFAGAASSPPFALPAALPAESGQVGTSTSIQFDSSGNVYASTGGPAGYDVHNPALTSSVIASGLDSDTELPGSQIAIDMNASPTRIYVQEVSASEIPQIAEYDNESSSPSFLSTDSDNDGLFVDASGNVYTSSTAGLFHVYPRGGLQFGTSNVQYSIAGKSLAFDSAGYVYAVTAAGAITVYAPQSSAIATTLPGTTYGQPALGPYEFGTFCR
jgi:hypothetical protein